MISNYTNHVLQVFEPHRNAERAASMCKYMKDKFAYYGVDSPTRKEICKPLLHKDALPRIEEAPGIMQELWDQPEREIQYFALEFVQKYARKSPLEWIDLYEQLITQKSWWDSVDGLAATQVGGHFKKYPQLISEYTTKWMESGHIWLQRTCLLFQLKYKNDTDFELLRSFIEPLVESNEFFIRKAIGWALRQYSKFQPQVVLDYLEVQPMSNLSYREALKVIERAKA